jgi:hypothetical protein
MGIFRSRWRMLTVFAAGLAFGSAVVGAAMATIPDSAGVIHACYAAGSSPTGNLRVINTGSGQSCKKSEKALTWNQTGARGAPGATGAMGPQGIKGDKGDKGDTGAGGSADFAYIGYGASGALLVGRTSNNVSIAASTVNSTFQCVTTPFVTVTVSAPTPWPVYLRGDDNGVVETYCPPTGRRSLRADALL